MGLFLHYEKTFISYLIIILADTFTIASFIIRYDLIESDIIIAEEYAILALSAIIASLTATLILFRLYLAAYHKNSFITKIHEHFHWYIIAAWWSARAAFHYHFKLAE